MIRSKEFQNQNNEIKNRFSYETESLAREIKKKDYYKVGIKNNRCFNKNLVTSAAFTSAKIIKISQIIYTNH